MLIKIIKKSVDHIPILPHFLLVSIVWSYSTTKFPMIKILSAKRTSHW